MGESCMIESQGIFNTIYVQIQMFQMHIVSPFRLVRS
jgi:hypothetical protein